MIVICKKSYDLRRMKKMLFFSDLKKCFTKLGKAKASTNFNKWPQKSKENLTSEQTSF